MRNRMDPELIAETYEYLAEIGYTPVEADPDGDDWADAHEAWWSAMSEQEATEMAAGAAIRPLVSDW